MKIVFMGTPSYATEILKKLISFHEVVALFTQMDKAVGRKKILTPPHIKDFVLKNNLEIPIFQPKNLRSENVEESIKNLNPDFIIVAAYGQILPKNILQIAPCINLHASILPSFRGASPIQSAILEDEKYSGVTAMMMEEGLDSGDMLGFSYVKLQNDITSEELFEVLSSLAAKLILKVLEDFEKIYPLSQKNLFSSYAKKVSKKDGEVDIYTQDAKQIYIKARAFTPWPGIFLPNGVKILTCKTTLEQSQQEAGQIVKINKDEVLLKCKNGILSVSEVQPPSKKAMSAYSYVLGLRRKVGDTLY